MLMSSRFLVASDLRASARPESWPTSWPVTLRVSLMVVLLSRYHVTASSPALVSGFPGLVAALCKARISLEDATSTL
jgi:hypothetical protein